MQERPYQYGANSTGLTRYGANSIREQAPRLLGLLVVRILAVFHGVLEVLNPLAQALTEVGNLTGAKDQDRDKTNYQKFWKTKFTQHGRPSGGRLIRADL